MIRAVSIPGGYQLIQGLRSDDHCTALQHSHAENSSSRGQSETSWLFVNLLQWWAQTQQSQTPSSFYYRVHTTLIYALWPPFCWRCSSCREKKNKRKSDKSNFSTRPPPLRRRRLMHLNDEHFHSHKINQAKHLHMHFCRRQKDADNKREMFLSSICENLTASFCL